MKIEFVLAPDVAGMGRLVVDGRYYALPAPAVVALHGLAHTLTSFEDAFGEAVDNDDDINGGDAVEFIGGYLIDVRAALDKIGG